MARLSSLSLMLVAALSVSACGFHLRGVGGSTDIPFRTMYVEGGGGVATGLQQYLRAVPGMTLAKQAKDAEATIAVVSEKTDKTIRSLNQAGKVSEYELHYSLTYTLLGASRQPLFPTSEINIRRYMTYEDSFALGKEQEEAMLVRDMQQDATQQILRRLTVYKPRPEDMASRVQ